MPFDVTERLGSYRARIANGAPQVTRVFTITGVDPNNGGGYACFSLPPPIPQEGEQLPEDSSLIVIDRQVEFIDGSKDSWTLTATYGIPGGAASITRFLGMSIQIGLQSTQENIDLDRKAILWNEDTNRAEGTTVFRPATDIAYPLYLTQFDADRLNDLAGDVNFNALFGAPSKFLMFTGGQAQQLQTNLWFATFNFSYVKQLVRDTDNVVRNKGGEYFYWHSKKFPEVDYNNTSSGSGGPLWADPNAWNLEKSRIRRVSDFGQPGTYTQPGTGIFLYQVVY